MFLALVILVLIGLSAIIHIGSINNSANTGEQKAVVLTQENLPAYLESNQIINDLPEDGAINIYFGDDVYSIVGNSVDTGTIEDADITIKLPGNYFGKEFRSICGMIKGAVSKGDLYFETSLSKTKLLWKYRGLVKYRDCMQ